MTTIRYGLRDTITGQIVRIYAEENVGRQFCNDESVTLELGSDPRCRATADSRYEVEDLKSALRALRVNPAWFNSSREDPAHGNVDVEQCEVVMFRSDTEYSAQGGDPIRRTETVHTVVLPPALSGQAVESHRKLPDKLLSGIFGSDWEGIRRCRAEADEGDLDVNEPEDLILIVASTTDDVETNALVRTRQGNTYQVVAAVALPDSWPLRNTGFSCDEENLKLLACRWQNFIPAGILEPEAPRHHRTPAL